jgi:hypothetical protein
MYDNFYNSKNNIILILIWELFFNFKGGGL